VVLNGFKIPKNTQIVPLLHAVHMDPNLWDEPEKFKPTRFLNAEGKVTKPEYFLPFGVGKHNFQLNKKSSSPRKLSKRRKTFIHT
jgi:26-hydroxylase